MTWFRRIISPGGLTVALALIPPLILAGLVAHYAVDVPYQDQWSFSQLTAYYRTGGRDLAPLFAQHNEARMLFPAPLNLACEYLAGGNLRACAIAALLLAALSLFNVYRMTVLSLPRSAATRMAITVLASVMIFSPVQWSNWLWGNQLALLFPAACLTGAICVTYSELRFQLKLAICAALAFVATFSFPNGILCWAVLPPLLLWQPKTAWGRAQTAAIWLAAAAGSVWLFLRDFHSTAGLAAWRDSLAQPKFLLLSIMGFLGAPLSSGGEIWLYRSGRLVSLVLLSLLAAACLAVIMGHSRLLWRRSAGWLALCAFVLGSAAATALGRTNLSSVFLHESRYTSFSVYLVIGVAGSLAVVRAEWPGSRQQATRLVAGTLLAAVLGLHLSAAAQSLEGMETWRAERLQSKACLALINVVDSPCTVTKLGIMYDQIAGARVLNSLGLLHPPLLATAQLPANRIATAPLDNARGAFTSLRRLPDESWIASGFAVLPSRDEPADGVVITYDDAKGERQVAALADTLAAIPGGSLASHWAKWFVLPEGATLVRAYAYDTLADEFFLIAPAQSVAGAVASPIRFETELSGSLDRLARGFVDLSDPREALMLFGWSFLRVQARTPDAILVTCEGAQRIVGSGETHMPRPDVVRALGGNPRMLNSGFGALIDEGRLPPGGCPLRAWGYDSTSNTAHPLQSTKDSGPVLSRATAQPARPAPASPKSN